MAKRKILIVDDNAINRQILGKILADDYCILEAADGKEALEIVTVEKAAIAVILLDLVMPVMDGYAFLRQQQRCGDISNIPVIVLTQQESEETESLALSLGALDFLTKPYKPAIIKHRIANTIRLRETASMINAIEKDPLTGMYNKSFFSRRAEEILREYSEYSFDLICMDIEKFKLVNDLFGNAEGDKLLQYIAEQVQEKIGSKGLCGRLEADNFVLLLPHRDVYLPEWFEDGMNILNNYHLKMNLVLRFGIYVIDDIEVPINVMCDRAKLAIESIKGKYAIYHAYYDASIRERLLVEQRITDEMQPALENKEFVVYFQPKYDLLSGKIMGAEALVRWRHPQRGLILPGEFIPLFEKNGFITDVDIFVWDSVCAIIRSWIDHGHLPIPISVNVSRVDIYNPHLSQILLDLVHKYDILPELLHLEITETAYTHHTQQLVCTVKELKQLGFTIEMDDFGSGYSSLNMLSELPLDTLKLDMVFLQKKVQGKNNENIVSFIVSLAKWLGLSVVAEGIETEEQVNFLQKMNCNYGQGYYFSRPLCLEDFEQLLLTSEISVVAVGEQKRQWSEADYQPCQTVAKTMLLVSHKENGGQELIPIFQADYEIVTINNYSGALSYLLQHKGEINVVLLELTADDCDYGTFMLQAKSLSMLKAIPMVVVATNGSTQEITALQLGAADVITPPVAAGVIKLRVDKAVHCAELQMLNGYWEQRAESDWLTGLFNRYELETQMQRFFDGGGQQGAFVMLDIDNFKVLNDTFGHQHGDHALRQVAQVLQSALGSEDIIARMGGDEFAVFLPYALSLADLVYRLTSLCRKLNFLCTDGAMEMEISCSLGGCLAPLHGTDYQSLYANADKALLVAKRLGKNQYQIFGEEMQLPSPVVQQNLNWLLDEASDGIVVINAANWEILYANKMVASIAHKSRRSCVGQKCYEALWGLTQPCSECSVFKAPVACQQEDLLQQEFVEREFILPGMNKHFSLKGKLIDWDGTRSFIQYVQDDTVKEIKKRADQDQLYLNIAQQQEIVCQLDKTNKQLQTILENVDVGIAMIQGNQERVVPIFFNDRFCQMLHSNVDKLIQLYGQDAFCGVHPEDLPRVQAVFFRAMQDKGKFVASYRICNEVGVYIPIRINANVIEEKDGTITYYAVYTDLSDKTAELK